MTAAKSDIIPTLNGFFKLQLTYWECLGVKLEKRHTTWFIYNLNRSGYLKISKRNWDVYPYMKGKDGFDIREFIRPDFDISKFESILFALSENEDARMFHVSEYARHHINMTACRDKRIAWLIELEYNYGKEKEDD